MRRNDWCRLSFVACISLVVGVSYGLSFGDGSSNHPVYLISGLRIADPDFLRNDWWAAHTTHYHTAFSYLVAVLQKYGVLAWSLALINIIVIICVLEMVYFLILKLDNEYGIFIWITLIIIFFCIDRTRSVALTYLFTPSLQPSTISSICFLAAIIAFVENRFILSGSFAALSGLFHTNFLLLAFPCFAFAHFLLGWKMLLSRLSMQFCLLVFVLAIQFPIIIHIAGIDLPREIREEANKIIINIGAPFHYKPMTFLVQFSHFFGWNIVALSLFWMAFDKSEISKRFRSLFLSCFTLVTISTIFTTVMFYDNISRLFVWRLAPFCMVFAYIVLAKTAVNVFVLDTHYASFPRPLHIAISLIGFLLIVRSMFFYGLLQIKPPFITVPGTILLLSFLFFAICLFEKAFLKTRFSMMWSRQLFTPNRALFLFFAFLLAIVVNDFNLRRYNLLYSSEGSRAHVELYQWVKMTDPTSTFVIPPGLFSFRLFGERAVVADVKALPFRADEVLEWYERMRDLCGDDHVGSLEEMERGYDLLGYRRLKRVVEKYGADYVVVRQGLNSIDFVCDIVFENSLYKVIRANTCRSS